MILKDIVNESIYCSVGTIQNKNDIEILHQRLLYNFDVISKFDTIIISQNKSENISDLDFFKFNEIWKIVFPKSNIIVIPLSNNKGYVFGCVELDYTVLEKCKEYKNKKYIWKNVNDYSIEPMIFNREYKNEDFLFLPEQGYAGLIPFINNIEDYVDNCETKYFFPQCNFYIIENKFDNLTNQKHLNEMYSKFLQNPEHKTDHKKAQWKLGLPTTYLIDMLKRNNYKNIKVLVSKNSILNLCKIILQYKICDSSCKNIYYNEIGLCHLHSPDQIVINL